MRGKTSKLHGREQQGRAGAEQGKRVHELDGGGTNALGEFSEASLAKARRALNDLGEKAWVELDDKMFQCKGFQAMNRETYGQVGRDISRLLVQINDMSRIESECLAGISQKEQEIIDVEKILTEQTALYNTQYAEKKAELTIRQNDLDVFQFMLVFAK